MKIIKNILSKEELNTFKRIIFSDDFAWFYNHKSVTYNSNTTSFLNLKKKYKNLYEHPYFTHNFINKSVSNSPWLKPLSSIFDKIYKDFNIKKIIRIKINYQPQYNLKKTEIYSTPHVDLNEPNNYSTILFYLNTCDGYTYFFDDKKVIKKIKSIGNSLVQFDGDLLHGGSHPKKDKERIVLNINYI